MQRLAMICAILGLTLGSARLAAWTLEPCNSGGENAQSHREYRRALEAAAPGTSLYTPHLFPTAQEDIVENFLYYHRNALSRAAELPQADRVFFDLLQQGRIRFQAIRVVNWSPLACGPRKQRAFYHVLRAFDRVTGEELLRVSVEDNGHVFRVRHKPEHGSLAPIPSLTEAGTSVKARSGVQPRNLQYVATWGTLRCDEVQPCVAFQDGSETYLVEAHGKALYRLELTKRSLSMRKDLKSSSRDARILSLREEGRELVSLGYDRFTTAVPASAGYQR